MAVKIEELVKVGRKNQYRVGNSNTFFSFPMERPNGDPFVPTQEDVDHKVYEQENPPEQTPEQLAQIEMWRQVPKLLIVQRVIAAGKGAEFKAELTAADREKWDARQTVPAGHPRLGEILTSIGLDPDVILAPGKPDPFD